MHSGMAESELTFFCCCSDVFLTPGTLSASLFMGMSLGSCWGEDRRQRPKERQMCLLQGSWWTPQAHLNLVLTIFLPFLPFFLLDPLSLSLLAYELLSCRI